MTTDQPASAALVPGLTLCADCRTRDAELTVDPGERWARHICFDCLEDVIERENAVHIDRSAVNLIQRARREPARPLPVPITDWETADQSKLVRLRAQWRAYAGLGMRTLAGASRCWAVLPTGVRCGRQEHEAGLCETHLYRGASVPGLGWAEDVPQGPIVARRGRKELAA